MAFDVNTVYVQGIGFDNRQEGKFLSAEIRCFCIVFSLFVYFTGITEINYEFDTITNYYEIQKNEIKFIVKSLSVLLFQCVEKKNIRSFTHFLKPFLCQEYNAKRALCLWSVSTSDRLSSCSFVWLSVNPSNLISNITNHVWVVIERYLNLYHIQHN